MVDQRAATSERNVRKLFDLINQDRLDRLGEVVSEDYMGASGERGPTGFGAVIGRLKAGVADLRYALDEVLAEGDQVAVQWTWSGKHTGTLNGFAASGKTVKNTGMAIFELRDGKIVGASLETDRLGLLQQIGVLPALVGGSRPDLRFHVDNFVVPEDARQEFEATMRRNMSFIRALPGFVGHTVLERTSGPTAFNITTVAIWQDQQALDAAVARVRAHYEQIGFDGPATLARWGAKVERGHFRAPPELQ